MPSVLWFLFFLFFFKSFNGVTHTWQLLPWICFSVGYCLGTFSRIFSLARIHVSASCWFTFFCLYLASKTWHFLAFKPGLYFSSELFQQSQFIFMTSNHLLLKSLPKEDVIFTFSPRAPRVNWDTVHHFTPLNSLGFLTDRPVGLQAGAQVTSKEPHWKVCTQHRSPMTKSFLHYVLLSPHRGHSQLGRIAHGWLGDGAGHCTEGPTSLPAPLTEGQ